MIHVKHAADRVLALVALVLALPLLAAAAVAVLVDSGRPVIFAQPRVGKDGRTFRMYKLRTMVPNAVDVARRLRLSEDPFGVVPNDPRITPTGRFLRRTGVDELPQLVNILRGEMSFVGPRPDIPEQVANYTDEERRRLAVRPGMTGWAQTHGREGIPWPERFRLDLWYVDNWSLRIDLKILLLTVREFFRPEPEPVEDTMNIERARAKENASRRAEA